MTFFTFLLRAHGRHRPPPGPRWAQRISCLLMIKAVIFDFDNTLMDFIRMKKAAVEAALRYEWSNGQLEGQVNRIKAIKRAMYGRASFDLLSRKILRAG